ncbi:exported hypothetical protein [Frankia sp. AgKG'84/4]
MLTQVSAALLLRDVAPLVVPAAADVPSGQVDGSAGDSPADPSTQAGFRRGRKPPRGLSHDMLSPDNHR